MKVKKLLAAKDAILYLETLSNEQIADLLWSVIGEPAKRLSVTELLVEDAMRRLCLIAAAGN